MGDEAPAGREFSGAPPASPADAHRQDSRLDEATYPERRFVPAAAWRSPGGVVRRGRGPRPRDGDPDRATGQADPARADRRRDRRTAFTDWLTALIAPGTVVGSEFGGTELRQSDIARRIGATVPAVTVHPALAELYAITSPDIEFRGDSDTYAAPFLRTYTYDYTESGSLSLTVSVTEAHAIADTEPIANRNA